MKTAHDVITDFQELPKDEQQLVVSHQTHDRFSEDEIETILKAKEDAKQGINMSGPFFGEEAIDHLRGLREAKD